MICLRRTMFGAMSFGLCFSAFLSAKGSSDNLPAAASPDTNAMVDVWRKLSPAIKLPGSHYTTTNADGTVINHFNMQPVVTNMVALTNGLDQLEQQQAAIEQEMKSLPQRENILRAALMQDSKIMANIVTNFVPADAEGKQIKERMIAVEKELKQLRGEMKKRLEVDPEFMKAKAKMDEDAAALKVIQERKMKLREERGTLGAQIGAINQLKKRELEKKDIRDNPKAATP